MTNVIPLMSADISSRIVKGTMKFESLLHDIVQTAKNDSVPQGIIVALLQVQLHIETQKLIDS